MAHYSPLVSSILHPTDFSAASERAFAHALAVAVGRKATLTILHVGPEAGANVPWMRYPAVRNRLESWGLLRPGSQRSDVFDALGVTVRKVSLKGRDPGRAAKQLLWEEPHDLIVLATEGREGPWRWLHRSVAEGIASWPHAVTLFVPADAERHIVSLDDGALRLSNVLLPIDRTPDPTDAAEYATRVAQFFGTGNVSITALHVGNSDLAGFNPAAGDGWTWTVERREGDVVPEILDASDRHNADLIVMATAGRHGLLDMLRGSTTEQVLRKAPCPVLAVPQGVS